MSCIEVTLSNANALAGVPRVVDPSVWRHLHLFPAEVWTLSSASADTAELPLKMNVGAFEPVDFLVLLRHLYLEVV